MGINLHTIPFEHMLLATVIGIVLSLLMIFASRTFRYGKGHRLSALVSVLLAGTTGVAALKGSSGLEWQPWAVLSTVWLVGWGFRTSLPSRAGQQIARFAGRPGIQAVVLLVWESAAC